MDPTVLSGRPRDPFLDLDIAVVTPLFGGGGKPARVDKDFPIHGKAIRGHLRFWWRACRGSGFSTAADLFAEESLYWGSTDKPGLVDLVVTIVNAGSLRPCQERKDGRWRWHPGYPGYALFPFQARKAPDGQWIPPGDAAEGVRFRLRVYVSPGPRANQAREEVLRAVWAWLTFGGVGARTRRGCGSLHCVSCSDSRFRPWAAVDGDVTQWLQSAGARFVSVGRRALPIPALSGASVVAGPPSAPAMAWEQAVEVMRGLRQEVDIGRDPRPGKPGRSRWPEADSIREIAMSNGLVFQVHHQPAHPARPYFPRADLGLPIVFHFHSDPKLEATLEGTMDRATRMASPFILKSLMLPNGTAVPLLLLFHAPHVWHTAGATLRLTGSDKRTPPRSFDRPVTSAETQDRSKAGTVLPISNLGATTAREALLKLACARWHAQPVRL
jgi:CRISPR-associated protein Cmr1